MNRLFCFLSLGLLLTLFTGCSEDDSPDVPTYSVKITNTTNIDVDLYLESPGQAPKILGNLESGENESFLNMRLETDYTIYATGEGEDFDQSFFEDSFRNSNPEVLSLNLDVTL